MKIEPKLALLGVIRIFFWATVYTYNLKLVHFVCIENRKWKTEPKLYLLIFVRQFFGNTVCSYCHTFVNYALKTVYNKIILQNWAKICVTNCYANTFCSHCMYLLLHICTFSMHLNWKWNNNSKLSRNLHYKNVYQYFFEPLYVPTTKIL